MCGLVTCGMCSLDAQLLDDAATAVVVVVSSLFSSTGRALKMSIGCRGRSDASHSTMPMRCSVVMPELTRPKIVCFPSKCEVGASVRKNWLPLVFLPALACGIERSASKHTRSGEWNQHRFRAHVRTAPPSQFAAASSTR